MQCNRFSGRAPTGRARTSTEHAGPCDSTRHAAGPNSATSALDMRDADDFMRAAQESEPQLRAYIRRFPDYASWEEDILQSTWLAAWQHRGEYAGPGTHRAWLFRICQSVLRQTVTIERRFTPLANDGEIAGDAAISEVEAYADDELHHARLSQILLLPPRRRSVVLLRLLTSKSTTEVASLLGCRPGTIKATVHQAKEWLRERDPARGSRPYGATTAVTDADAHDTSDTCASTPRPPRCGGRRRGHRQPAPRRAPATTWP